MPNSAASSSHAAAAPDAPPGVELPAGYQAKRCRRCGLLGCMNFRIPEIKKSTIVRVFRDFIQ